MMLKQVIRYANADALEATWVDENDVVIKCQAYSNSQMDMLAADLSDDAPQYQALMDEVAATYVAPVFDLAAAKAEKNAQINAWRLQANRGTFNHGGKLFACDELSRGDIDGITSFVTLAGALPPGWPGAWKAVDNSFFPIATVPEWAAFVASMVAAGNAHFAKAQTLKAQLSAATTQAQIDAIVW